MHCAFATGRRGLLSTGIGTAAGFLVPRQDARSETLPDDDPRRQRQAFYGLHQAGITTARPPAALFAAFDVIAENRVELARMFRDLSGQIAFLMRGGPIPVANDRLPPPDSGLLGPQIWPDNLTMTIGVGASLFDDRYGLATRRPRRLVAMAQFPNDALDEAMCHGDLLLQICSNAPDTNIHALRSIVKASADTLALRWKIEGFLPPAVPQARGETHRNMLGFKDGTANPEASDSGLMDRLVWVHAGVDEPAWTTHGTYQVVRIIRTLVEHWDRTPLAEQQTIIGRDKATGAPLGQSHESDLPDYANDKDGARIRLDAHIRLANPRLPETEGSRILRRPFNYSLGLTKAGQLDMGLLFVCFQRDLDAGFLAVQKRLNGEPLEEYVKPVGGGYFFVLPGAVDSARFLGDTLVTGS